MAEAFYAAAKAGIQALKGAKRFGIKGMAIDDFKAYPVLYLYRHALELSMKAILIEGTKMLELKKQPEVDEQNLFSNHSLEWLRQEVERVFVVCGWGWDCGNAHFGSVKDLREVIGELQKIDARSFAFRYPVTTKGEPSLPESFRFSLFRFCRCSRGVVPDAARRGKWCRGKVRGSGAGDGRGPRGQRALRGGTGLSRWLRGRLRARRRIALFRPLGNRKTGGAS